MKHYISKNQYYTVISESNRESRKADNVTGVVSLVMFLLLAFYASFFSDTLFVEVLTIIAFFTWIFSMKGRKEMHFEDKEALLEYLENNLR